MVISRTRKILVAAGFVLVFGMVVGASVYYFTKGVADAASDFFATIASAGPEAAYRKTSPAFQQAMNESDFVTLVDRLGLTRFKSASWTEREVQSGQGSVSGTLVLDKDVSLPAKVQLTKNGAGDWQVFNFNLQLPGVAASGQSASQPAPSQPSQGQPPKVVSSTQAGDEISAEIGDKPWSASGQSLIVLKLGNAVLVDTTPIVKADHTIDTTSLRLQFDGGATGTQKLTRNCQQNAPCLELSADGNHYKIDESPNATATLTITKEDAGRIEGSFSADIVALEGRLAVHQGHFVVTVK